MKQIKQRVFCSIEKKKRANLKILFFGKVFGVKERVF